ncbi:MAG: CoA transferase [Dehalococcoidia bacterium]
MSKLALEGVRILDLTQVAAGPYATLLLGFMGAEVIKLESCSRIDINRGTRQLTAGGLGGVFPGGDVGDRPWNRTARHVHRNANKVGVTLDLTTARGRELFLALVAKCDAVMENFRASVMGRLDLGYDVLSEVNPQLIYVKISSQGATGPEMNYGSMGSTLEQTGGLASITGYEDGVPLMTNETYPDPVVGILTVGAFMAALRRRRQTGKGTFVDMSQREVTATLLGEAVLDYSMNGRVATPMGNRHPTMVPHGCYPCQGDDMWLVIAVGSDEEWQALCEAMSQPQLARDPRFETQPARRQNELELDRIITTWTTAQDHYEAMGRLQDHGVAAGAVLKGSEVLADPHLNARGFWDSVNHPEAGPYKQVTTPWRLSRSPRRETFPSPSLGEHNSYVLGDVLGLSGQEIRDLEEQGVIGTRPAEAS